MLFHSTVSSVPLNSSWMLTSENRPSSWKAPTPTVRVGTTRKTSR